MSADNGVYILQSKDGFRVIHAQAIENIFSANTESGFNQRYLKQYFGRSQVFNTRDEVWEEALEIANKQYILEYGICIIPGHEDIEFPTD